MCMMLGFSSKERYELSLPIWNLLEQSVNHPDGWGLAAYNNLDKHPMIVKESIPAYKSAFAKNLCDGKITGRLVIAHIRKKTYGSVSFDNTHPFVQRVRGEEWVFAHNGSVDLSYLKSSKSSRRPIGDTDSEKISCYISDQLDKLPNEVSIDSKIDCIDKAVSFLAAYGKLNLLFTDGTHLFVHTNCADTLYMHSSKGYSVFGTKPMTSRKWSNVPLNTLLVFKDGIKIFEGLSHGNEFIRLPETRFIDNGYGG